MSVEYLKHINVGIHDEEISDTVPINLTQCQSFWNCLLPIGSIRRYLTIRFAFITLVLIAISIYILVSILLFRVFYFHPTSCYNKRKMIYVECQILEEFLWSIAGQLIVFATCAFIYLIFGESCEKSWKTHKSRTHSANSHKST